MTMTAELERQAERTRADLSSTLDELRGSVTRTAITSGATALAREGGSALARAAVQRASDNPLAALLIGAGIAMMFTRFSGSNGSGGSNGVSGLVQRANSAVKGAVSKVGDVVSRTTDVASDMADNVTARARDRAGYVNESVREQAGRLSDRATDAVAGAASSVQAAGAAVTGAASAGFDRARELTLQGSEQVMGTMRNMQDRTLQASDTITRFAQEQPVVVAALAVAVGAALGAALPVTETERRYLGSSAARVTAKGRELAEHVSRAVAPQAAEAAEVATETVAKEVLGETRQQV